MCFYVKTPREVAKEDIITYKLLNEDLSSIHHDYSYKIGEKQKEIRLKENGTNILNGNNTLRLIYEGYHSYSTYEKANRISFLSNRAFVFSLLPILLLVKCIIPKGSEYYSNYEAKEKISSNIIIISKGEKNEFRK